MSKDTLREDKDKSFDSPDSDTESNIDKETNKDLCNNNTLDSALSYNSKGWNVIPILRPGEIINVWNSKEKKHTVKPADGKSAEGSGPWSEWIDKKQSREDVIKLFKDKGNCNIALVTGKVSGIIAFDIDSEVAEQHFYSVIEKLVPEIENAIKNTMQCSVE